VIPLRDDIVTAGVGAFVMTAFVVDPGVAAFVVELAVVVVVAFVVVVFVVIVVVVIETVVGYKTSILLVNTTASRFVTMGGGIGCGVGGRQPGF
jgi:hypothetical protein